MICRECKYCKRLYVPVVPSLDHARTVRDRFVCIAFADEGTVQYLGDDEGECEMFSEVCKEIESLSEDLYAIQGEDKEKIHKAADLLKVLAEFLKDGK